MSQTILRVQLFGSFNLIYDNVPVTGVQSARLQSLLAYLILHADQPQSRSHLAFVLWPDAVESQARNNLRQFVFQLRQVIPDPDRYLLVDARSICWKTDEGQVSDVARIKDFLRRAVAAEQSGDSRQCRRLLEQGIALYQGDLLPNCYDDWIAPERDQLRQQCRQACMKLTQLREADREYVAALEVARTLQQLDPLDEQAYILLLRLHNLNDDPAGARRVYQTAIETLQREAGAAPGPELEAAYQRSQQVLRRDKEKIATGAYALVGRQNEWCRLRDSWQRAAGGEAHLTLITGEAGIGKSRLAEELFHYVTHQGFSTAYTRSYGREGSLSLAPVTEWLRSPALRPYLASLDAVWLTELARLLPELLTEYPDLPRPEPITEYGSRRRFFEAIANGVLAAPSPLLLWMDDLQWCDQETLEWLHFLLRFAPRHPLLLLGTARSEESPPNHPLSGLTRQLRAENRGESIELSPFDASETAKLASLVQGHAMDDSTSVHLYRETEGYPLFVVEAVRAGMIPAMPSRTDSVAGALSTPSLPLPPRVQAIISGRLAQLSPAARTVAETGAAIGRAFTLDLLLLAGQEKDEAVIPALDELWLRRIVREQSANVFDFTHDKLREVTYTETGLPQRRSLHRRIAHALESLNAGSLDLVCAQVAAHYEEAGLFEKAIPYYQRAGEVAAGVYANEDAIHLYTRALELLGRLPASAALDIQELNIVLALATLYRISRGWASPEEERVIHRAIVLSDRVGDVKQRIRALFGLLTVYLVQAQYEKVDRSHALAMSLFEQIANEPPPFVGIHLAGAKLHRGRMIEAQEQFEKSLAVRDYEDILGLQKSQGADYLVHGLAWNAHAFWCLGYPDAAMKRAQDAMALARESAQPFNQALAIAYLTLLQVWQADSGTLMTQAETACRLIEEYRTQYYYAWANILLHFARAEQQPGAGNLDRLRNAIHTFTETGARIRLPVYYSLLAQVCLKGGRLAEGCEALEQALSESDRNDERWWDAEIHRLRGELMWAQGADADNIEAAFLRAAEIARGQQVKSLELRATTGLARFWKTTGRPVEARQRLTEIYSWFTEGFSTRDLQAARALIAEF